jgi:hypothetical protein
MPDLQASSRRQLNSPEHALSVQGRNWTVDHADIATGSSDVRLTPNTGHNQFGDRPRGRGPSLVILASQ